MMLFRKLYQQQAPLFTKAPTLFTQQPMMSLFTLLPRTANTVNYTMMNYPLRMFSGGNLREPMLSSTVQSGFTSRVVQKQSPFNTDTPAKSARHHRGLYHGKTHGRRFQRCFSMKKSIVTMQPNIKSRNLYSEILG